jgi:hypothetical protein
MDILELLNLGSAELMVGTLRRSQILHSLCNGWCLAEGEVREKVTFVRTHLFHAMRSAHGEIQSIYY